MGLPATGIYMVGYEELRDVLNSSILPVHYHHLSPLLAGSTARSIAAVFVSPLELIRTRIQQTQNADKSLRGVLDGVGAMVRKMGWQSLWRGLVPTLWRDVPFSAMYWYGYEEIKRSLTRRLQHSSINTENGRNIDDHGSTTGSVMERFSVAFMAGASSGMLAAFLTTPFDVAKSRRQMELRAIPDSPDDAITRQFKQVSRETKVLRMLAAIYRVDGWRGLMQGWGARVGKVAPSCAIMISTYELGKMLFGQPV